MEIQMILFLLYLSLGPCCGSVETQGVKELTSATALLSPFPSVHLDLAVNTLPL